MREEAEQPPYAAMSDNDREIGTLIENIQINIQKHS